MKNNGMERKWKKRVKATETMDRIATDKSNEDRNLDEKCEKVTVRVRH